MDTIANKKSKLKPITAERFEREVRAITRLFNQKVLSAAQHKAKYDALVRRLHATD